MKAIKWLNLSRMTNKVREVVVPKAASPIGKRRSCRRDRRPPQERNSKRMPELNASLDSLAARTCLTVILRTTLMTRPGSLIWTEARQTQRLTI